MTTKEMIARRILYLFVAISLLAGCAGNKTENKAGQAPKKENRRPEVYDWEQIQDAGEFIIGTLSGPTTYFDNDGVEMGLHYALVSDFAKENGLHVQMVVAHTERELISLLQKKEIDLIACPLTEDSVRGDTLVRAGFADSIEETSWYVRKDCPHLAEALNTWYTPEIEKEISEKEMDRAANLHKVKFVARPMFISREKGQYSVYDEYFKHYAGAAGLDWRLVAGVCYAESGFDPSAISNAGAQGLMQLMPSVAKQYGVTNAFDPEQNIKGGTLLLRQLMRNFSDVDGQERVKFVLAAYNAGEGHIRDAQALARKYGKNPKNWTDVNEYILKLQQPEYYRDPVVKCGYMVGKETSNFVRRVAGNYRSYGGSITFAAPGNGAIENNDALPVSANGELKESKYKKNVHIVGPDDPMFDETTEETQGN